MVGTQNSYNDVNSALGTLLSFYYLLYISLNMESEKLSVSYFHITHNTSLTHIYIYLYSKCQVCEQYKIHRLYMYLNRRHLLTADCG